MSKLPGAKWDERAGAATNARRELPQLAASFFTQVRALLADDHRSHEVLAVAQARQRDAGKMDDDEQSQTVRDPGMQMLRPRRTP